LQVRFDSNSGRGILFLSASLWGLTQRHAGDNIHIWSVGFCFLQRFVCSRPSPKGKGLVDCGRMPERRELRRFSDWRGTVVVTVALIAAFLLGIVVGSGLEILVRSRVPSA
jgi:hypothetical protein